MRAPRATIVDPAVRSSSLPRTSYSNRRTAHATTMSSGLRTRSMLAVAACALIALCAWTYFALDGSERDARDLLAQRDEALHAARTARVALDGDHDAAQTTPLESTEPLALDAPHAKRSASYLIADPDTLVELRGRVLDAGTHAPIAGIRLSFMSRRPRTCVVTTDSDGRFRTGVELAPGVVSVAHLPDDDAPRYCVRWEVEPGEFLLSDPALAKQPDEIVLNARSPERVIEANVRTPDGAPAAGAAVTLTYGRRDAAGEFVSEGREYESADSSGRVRFAQFGADIFDRSIRIEAEQRGLFASDVITLDPPIGTRPLDVELHPGSVLRVHAKNDEGRPIANLSLWVSNNESGRGASGRNGDTDAHGDCMFTPLRAGCYSVNAVHPLTGETLQREIDLVRGEEASIDLRLTLANLRLGLSGAVLDEFGQPLVGITVRVQAPGESPVELSTGDGGRFEYWGRPVPALFFSIGTGFMDDEYEPGVLAVPFGTCGLGVRRVKSLELHTLPFAAVDQRTGAPVKRATVVLYHGDPAHALHSEQRFSAQAGVAEVSFKLRPDSGFAVDAPGYLRAQGSLRTLYESCMHSAALRVELVPGFERRLEVRDRVTKRTLAGARLFEDRRLVGTADAQGVIEISAAVWPSGYRVECAGYASIAWDPIAAGFPGDVIWLDPQRAR
jgi:hypothetical protein